MSSKASATQISRGCPLGRFDLDCSLPFTEDAVASICRQTCPCKDSVGNFRALGFDMSSAGRTQSPKQDQPVTVNGKLPNADTFSGSTWHNHRSDLCALLCSSITPGSQLSRRRSPSRSGQGPQLFQKRSFVLRLNLPPFNC